MTLQWQGKDVEVEIDRNADGSPFLLSGNVIDTDETLTDDELDALLEENAGHVETWLAEFVSMNRYTGSKYE